MSDPFRLRDWLTLLLVLIVAAGSRSWYLIEFADYGHAEAVWHVQDPSPKVDNLSPEVAAKKGSTELDVLVANIRDDGVLRGFRGYAPLGRQEEVTSHVSPGYPIVRGLIEKYVPDPLSPLASLRWIQVGLGSLTAMLYFLIARRAFAGLLVGALAGLFCALNPYWIINTAEVNDGTMASFLLAFALLLGIRGGQEGGALTSYVYGFGLAALALVRAALFPFALVAVLWFLLRSRAFRLGWLYALLAFLGLVTGLGLWEVRNFKEFRRVLPIVDTAWWHLWVGNNPQATGGPLRYEIEHYLKADERADLQRYGDSEQPKRYEMLAERVVDEMRDNPGGTLERRLFAALYFFTGEATTVRSIVDTKDWEAERAAAAPRWLEGTLYGTLLAMLLLGVLGWRWSYACRRTSMPLQLAVFWVPLVYLLTHAEWLHGPRLPLEGPLLCLAAFALCCFIPRNGVPLLTTYEATERQKI